jgi:serine phosphatase RsbU (regulator of sigma subunit)/Flp pilus assembly protein TadD
MRSILLCLLIIASHASAFSNNNDSLQLLLKKPLPDTSRIKVLKELVYLNNSVEPSQSIIYGFEGLTLAKKLGDIDSEIHLLNNIGIAYYGLGDYEKTLEYFLLVLEKEENLKNPQAQSRALNNLGIIYDEIGKLEKSIAYYEESLKIKETLNDSAGISNTLSNLGLLYLKMDFPDKAILCFRKCLKIDTESTYISGIYNSLHNIGLYHLNFKNKDSAVYYMAQAYEVIPKDEVNYDKAFIIKSYAKALLENKSYKNAEEKYKQAIEIAKKISSPEILEEAYKGIAEISEIDGNYKEALNYYKLHKAFNDSIFNTDFNKQIAKLEKNHEIKEREKEIQLLKNEAEITGLQLSTRKNTIYFLYALGLLLAILSAISYNRYKIKKKAHSLLEQKNSKIEFQKDEINSQKDEIEAQRDNILRQKQSLEEASKDIMESIWYAQNIQNAILPDLSHISSNFKDFFMLFLPKSIVSGDFYWYTEKGDKHYFVVADCTGHGIPGAFMTVMANDLLNSIIIQRDINDCAEILKTLDYEVMNSLQYKENSSNDGLDISLLCIDLNKMRISFSGACMNLLLIRNNKIQEYKGQRFSIGGFTDITIKKPINQQIDIIKGDQIYLYTDGYPDQFGGPNDKKFMIQNLKNLLSDLSSLPMIEQKHYLNKAFLEWKGENEQTDDICLAGIRF